MMVNHLQQRANVTVNGITVQLIFAVEANTEIPNIIRDMLKKSYFQQQGA